MIAIWITPPASTGLRVPRIIVENLYHHHEHKYQLLEYTVMPNHVHVLFLPITADAGSIGHGGGRVVVPTVASGEPEPDYLSDEMVDSRSPLSEIMHSLKSYTANEANKVLRRKGRFWQSESYDHWVRNEAELLRIAEYIANNAVSANLARQAWEWEYCSAHDRRHPRGKVLPEWW
jgi:putative transposase